MSAIVFYGVILLSHALYRFIDFKTAYFFIPFILLNFIFLVGLMDDLGKLICSKFQLPSGMVYRQLLGACILSLFSFFMVSSLPFPQFVFQFICTIYILFKIVNFRTQSFIISQSWHELRDCGFLPLLFLGLFGALSFIPNDYHDPLNYHLLGPLVWFKHHDFLSFEKNLQIIHCGYFEYLYLEIFYFFKMDFVSKIFVQIFCQLIHFYLGAFLAAILLIRFFKKNNISNSILITSSVFFILTRLSLGSLAVTAKNDWFIISLGLLVLDLMYFEDTQFSKNILLIIGFLLGLMISLKYSYAFFVLPLLFCIWKRKIGFGSLLLLGLAILFPLVPLFIRNYAWTGNPVFPLFNGFFKSDYLGPSWVHGFAVFGKISAGNLEWFAKVGQKILAKNLMNYLIFILPVFLFFKPIKRFFEIWLLSFASLILLFLVTPVELAETRHVGVAIIILQFLMLSSIIIYLKKLLNRHKFLIGFLSLNFMFFPLISYKDALPQHKIIKSEYKNLFSLGFENYVEENLGHNILDYLNKNPQIDSIFILSDIPLYYFGQPGSLKVWDWAKLDRAIAEVKSEKDFFKLIQASEAKYLLIDDYYFDRFYNPYVNSKIIDLIKRNESAIIYQKGNTYLIDVKSMARILEV